MQLSFLPLTRQEALDRGWGTVEIVLITGDAYVDHPSFGTAVIGRVLEARGYRVGIIAMPDWNDPASVTVFGKPRLFFGVTSGNVDSMLARYTAFKRYRSDDPYVPGGKAGRKPERALLVYCNLLKAAYKGVPIVIGGIEASMRRVAHYDFWSNKVRRSIIEDSRADALVYGMGEQAIATISKRLSLRDNSQEQQESRPKPAGALPLHNISGTVILSRELPENAYLLPSEEDVLTSKETFVEFYRQFYRHQNRLLAQPTGKRYLLHTPPAAMTSEALDQIYALPFQRRPHPSYQEPIPAFDMIRHSVTVHRGCVSGCSFCSLGLHQGKRIVSRSQESVLNEVRTIAQQPDFKGQISDIGGPSANMYGFDCRRDWDCARESCLFPTLCPNLKISTRHWLTLLQQALRIQNVKKVTIGSGIRYDVLMRDPEYTRILPDLIANHISGQLKIAPEHTSPVVLRAMRKTPLAPLKQFVQEFRESTRRKGKEQYPLPYLMSSHPGSTLHDMKAMLREIQDTFTYIPKQVQAFIPLPMTLSSVIFYTGIDPLTGEHFPVVHDLAERRKQHDVFFSKSTAHKRHKRQRSTKKR
jgi:uncharacterized radical SAM protein YgiQ